MQSNVVFRPTVVIGLGGTGYKTVVKLKKRFVDAYGSVPPIIRFLSIDTTENVAEGKETQTNVDGELDHNEQFVLQVSNPASLVSGANPHIDEWFPKDIPIGAIMKGAGQVRARGRLALFAESNKVWGKIRQAVDDVRNMRNQKEAHTQFQVSERSGVEVYIVSSLAGGTGSGVFLDIAFMTREIIGGDESSNFTGVLLLPRIFTQHAGTRLVKSNAYGALKEIEHLSTTKSTYRINYGTKQVDVDRPPFDLIYLIDSINEQGKVVSADADLFGLIADGLYVQIGSQIGTDSSNAVDNIKTQMATIGLVQGKSPQYCSFGVASLVLPSFDALVYEDARRLVNDGLLGGTVTDTAVEEQVMLFLDNNRLREDNADQVIDALVERKGGGKLRVPMNLGEMRYDAKALASIKTLHAAHRTKAERSVAQTVGENFTRLRDSVTAALDKWFLDAISHVHGFLQAQRFIEKVQAKFEWYQHMMETEARGEREKHKVLNFKAVEDEIQNATGAWIGREAKVKAACENYRGMVDRETELMISYTRLEKAAELYSALHAHTQSILDDCRRIRQNIDAARRAFEQQYLAVTSTRGGTRLFEQTVRFDADARRPAISGEDFVKWYADEHGSLSHWADMRAEDVQREIESYLTKRYEKLNALSIDEILQNTEPRVVAEDLNRVSNLAVPLWRYDAGKIPVVSTSIINEFYHYGVDDAETTILNEGKYKNGVPRGTFENSYVSTRDPKRILLFKVKTGVPLFALYDVDELEQAYKDPNKNVSNHVDMRWHELPNLIPRTGDGESLRWFAVAQEPELFNLVTLDGTWYSIKSKSGKKTEKSLLRLGQGRVQAFQKFEKNRDLVRETEEAIETIVSREGVAKVIEKLKTHSAKLAARDFNDEAVKDQIESEINAIDDYVRQMEKLG
jgi:hypothetical protein